MTKSAVLVLVLTVVFAAAAFPDDSSSPQSPATDPLPSHEYLLSHFVPQDSPEDSYRLELTLLSKGVYCYDLPIFDADWRKRGDKVIHHDLFMRTWKDVNFPFRSLIAGDRAVVYYPDHMNLGPVFLKKEESGWVLDRTQTEELIALGPKFWVVLDKKSPYFSLLSELFEMERTEIATKVWGYRPTKLVHPDTAL